MRLIDADAIVFTHAIARSIDDGHNWNELCVTKDEIEDMPSVEPERTAKVEWYPHLTKLADGHCECGEDVRDDWKYCPTCGARLEWK